VTNAATPILAAHIHHGVAGVAGPVVRAVAPDGSLQRQWLRDGRRPSGLALDIITHPSDTT
jgi:hypothetical protein